VKWLFGTSVLLDEYLKSEMGIVSMQPCFLKQSDESSDHLEWSTLPFVRLFQSETHDSGKLKSITELD